MFLILSLPRSRSAWLAHYLNYAPSRRCGHDIAIECSSIEDFLGSFRPGYLDGSVETGAVVAWRLLQSRMPAGTKFVTVHRPVQEVKDSLSQFGISAIPGELELRAELLGEFARQPGIVSLEYSDLNSPEVCRELFEYCLDLPWDGEHYHRLAKFNVQVNMKQRMEQLRKNAPKAEMLRAQVILETSKLTSDGAGNALH